MFIVQTDTTDPIVMNLILINDLLLIDIISIQFAIITTKHQFIIHPIKRYRSDQPVVLVYFMSLVHLAIPNVNVFI